MDRGFNTDPSVLSPDDIKVLEQARQRIQQLHTSIQSLQHEVMYQHPLPPWSSFQTNAAILAQHVQTLTAHLAKNAELLGRIAAYPSPNFPGRSEEAVLDFLLRKKLTPEVQTLVEEGRAIANVEASANDQNEELWQEASVLLGLRINKYVQEEAGDVYTVAERKLGVENVTTGLRRKLEEDDSSEEEDEDEEMEDVGVAVTTARTTSTGQIEFDMEKIQKQPDGKSMTRKELLRMATTGVGVDQGVGALR